MNKKPSPSLAAEMERLKPAWVFDERDPAAYLEVARLTEGSGVEVLLNYDEGFDTSL